MTRIPTELFDCERVNAYLESYLLDQVPPPERRGMRMHIHRCRACFDKVLVRDPLQLFAPLADQERVEEFWDGFWPAIQEGIRRNSESRLPRRLWMRAAAAILVTTALAVALGVLLLRQPPPAEVARVAGETATQSAQGGPVPQTVEQVRTVGSREVQVYSMSCSQATELVLIVDAGLEL